MYLKALEIQGFKSFPDKTVLTFGNDLTAIVGPNGSGKSNISDAIRWVMGEQSTKALRGAKMEDVIFGGTVKRSQVGFAEVSLILDNEDSGLPAAAAEVMVTRRYYRSGDSEYYINRQSARLKDINEMFMDTGLGREGYSIIGQGRIDEILSVKSTDRREIFEEAAGISKFRHRKEESERKLEATNDNLVRINDKIAELELQVEPLRQQAEKAKQYLVLRDELRVLEVSVWLENLEKLKDQAEKARLDHQAAKDELDSAHAALERLYAQVEEISQKTREQDVAAEGVREEISALEARSAELESSLAVRGEGLRNNQENILRLQRELDEQEGRSGGIKSQILERRKRIEEIDALAAAAREKIAGLLRQSELLTGQAGSLSGQITKLQEKEAAARAGASVKRAMLSAHAAAAQELYDRETEVRRELTQSREKLEETEKQASGLQSRLDAARDEALSLKNTSGGYEMRLKGRREVLGELERQVMSLTMDKNAADSRLAMLREMEREYEGFTKSVKTVMQEHKRGGLHNIYGPVSRLIRVPDQYTVAIETALGAAMQNIVVEREEDGKAAINLLKRRDIGRATFLPISSVTGREMHEKDIDREPGFQGVASELVDCGAKFEGVVRNLLGRTVITEDIDSAIAMAKKHGYRFRIVTLDGQVLNTGGSMTGGSVSKSSGILSRANEIERLQARLAELNGSLAEKNNQLEQAKRSAAAVEYELQTAREQLREAENSVLKLEGEVSHYKILLEGLRHAPEAFSQELDSIRSRLEDNKNGTELARTEVGELERQADENKAEADRLLSGREELTGQAGRTGAEISGLNVELAAYEAERAATLSGIEELENLRGAMKRDRLDRIGTVEDYQRKNEELDRQILELRQSLSETAGLIEERQLALKAAVDERLRLEGLRGAAEKESQGKNRNILLMERECARLEQKAATSVLEEKQILDRLWDTYELSHSEACRISLAPELMKQAPRRIGELKKEIAVLGNPNIGAIEEFDRVNTRYTYLTDQRDDVETAKAELEVIIRDITGEMTSIFGEKFKLINESFTETFVEIFGGGRASLELEDEDDILSCGIEIKVQPPGKQLKTLSLLSGGEKAFVAIALYFAILKVRPTPFCVMDEIDAALDDRNVARFAGYLRNLADKTQFIVITHRRGTMEQADVLYGVTMQEQGISKMVAIDLNRIAADLKI